MASLPTGKKLVPPFPIDEVIPGSLRKRMTDDEVKAMLKAIADWEKKLAKAIE